MDPTDRAYCRRCYSSKGVWLAFYGTNPGASISTLGLLVRRRFCVPVNDGVPANGQANHIESVFRPAVFVDTVFLTP